MTHTPGLFGTQMLPRDVQALLYNHKWTEPLNMVKMGATVDAESDRFPAAVGHENPDGTQDYGLFQLNSGHRDMFGFSTDEAYYQACIDPERAATMARSLFDNAKRGGGTGFEPWAAFGTTRYHDRLPAACRGLCNFAGLQTFGAIIVA